MIRQMKTYYVRFSVQCYAKYDRDKNDTSMVSRNIGRFINKIRETTWYRVYVNDFHVFTYIQLHNMKLLKLFSTYDMNWLTDKGRL